MQRPAGQTSRPAYHDRLKAALAARCSGACRGGGGRSPGLGHRNRLKAALAARRSGGLCGGHAAGARSSVHHHYHHHDHHQLPGVTTLMCLLPAITIHQYRWTKSLSFKAESHTRTHPSIQAGRGGSQVLPCRRTSRWTLALGVPTRPRPRPRRPVRSPRCQCASAPKK